MFNRFKKLSCNTVYTTVFIAIWTIIQTVAHIFTLTYLRWWRDCRIDYDMSGYDNFNLFLFFDDQKCTNNLTSKLTEYDAEWRESMTRQLSTVMIVYLTLDSLWIVTSVGLLTGACCMIREIWALVFYLPWITAHAIMFAFDIYCSIFFAVNIPYFGSFLDWFSLIGFANKIQEIHSLEGDRPDLVVAGASIIMTFISARGVVIWVPNLVFMIVVGRIAIKEYKTKYKKEERRAADVKRGPVMRTNSERIRNWHRYYDRDAAAREEKRSTAAVRICADHESSSPAGDTYPGDECSIPIQEDDGRNRSPTASDEQGGGGGGAVALLQSSHNVDDCIVAANERAIGSGDICKTMPTTNCDTVQQLSLTDFQALEGSSKA